MDFFRKTYKFSQIEDVITELLFSIEKYRKEKKESDQHTYNVVNRNDTILYDVISKKLQEKELYPTDKNKKAIRDTILWYLQEKIGTEFPPITTQIEKKYNSLIENTGGSRKKSKRRNKKSKRKGKKTYRRK
jgi:hypothetical protein